MKRRLPSIAGVHEPPLLVIGSSRKAVAPTHTSPKLPLSATIVTTLGCPTVALTLTGTVGAAGSLLATVKVPVFGPGVVALKVTSNGEAEVRADRHGITR